MKRKEKSVYTIEERAGEGRGERKEEERRIKVEERKVCDESYISAVRQNVVL